MAGTAESVRQQMTAFLSGKGLTAAQIAGVEGNAQVESGFRTDNVNPAEAAIGLFQWEGGRRTNLQHYAAANGTTETDLNAQLGFLWSELTGPESSALAALQGTTTAADAAAVFDQRFERSSGSTRAQRVAAAQAIADGGTVTGAAAGGSSATAAPAGLLGDALGGLLGGLGLDTLGRYVVDAALVLIGAALVMLAVSLIAKGGESSTPTTGPGGRPAPAHHEAEHAAEAAAA